MSKAKSEPKLKKFKLKDLNPAKYNPRTIGDGALAGLEHSLQKFGCVELIVVNVREGKNTIVGGHQRYKALRKLKAKEAVCVTVNLSDGDEKLLNLTLNNPEIQGEFIENLVDYIEGLKKQLADSSDFVSLHISELQGQISSLAISSDFFEDGAVDGIFSNSDFESITFIFSKEQVQVVKAAIRSKGKPEIANRVVELCREV